MYMYIKHHKHIVQYIIMFYMYTNMCTYMAISVCKSHLSSICSWFAVHCTSMNNSNSLISGDNKGYASMLMEFDKDPGSLPGRVCC